MHALAVLGYLPKLKGGLGLAFGAHFLHDFSIKMFLFNTLSTEKVSMSFLFSFPRYQTKCVIKFSFTQFRNYKIYVASISKAMADREKKRGKTEIEKFEHLENEKSFLDEIKNIFHSF